MLAPDPTTRPPGSPDVGEARTSPKSPGPAEPSNALPHRIGNYIIIERLGGGGFGDVYLGRHRWLGVPAAIKVMSEPIPSRARSAFIREARRLYQLRGHPGILELREFGLYRPAPGAEPRPYFASDPVPCLPARRAEDDPGTLTGFARARNLDLRERLELFARVCDAVHHAHTRRVIHLDLKPANILVVPDTQEQPAQPKVIDFGIGRAADPTRQMLLRGVQGTLPYMSPEQTVSGAPLDARSDVYSLGVVLYELVCGKLPYSMPDSASAAVQTVREASPDPAGLSAAHVPPPLQDVIATALQKDPAQRYASAAQLAEDVRTFLAGHLPAASGSFRPRGWRTRLARMIGFHPYVSAAAVLALSVLLTFAVGIPLLYSWTGATGRFEAAFVRPLAAAPLRDVVIVPRTPESDAELGVGPDKPYRRACAQVLEALAGAEPAAVVLDHYYEEGDGVPRDATLALAAAARQLRARCPVIVGIRKRERSSDGVPTPGALDPALRQAVTSWGYVGFCNPISRAGPWSVDVLIQDEAGTTPSLALSAVLAAFAPDHRPRVTLDPGSNSVRLRFQFPGVDPNVEPDYDPKYEMILVLSRVGKLEQSELEVPGGAQAGDTVANMHIPLPTEPQFAAVELSMSKIARHDPDELARVRGKFVLIAEGRPGADLHDDGSIRRHGSRVHAALMQMLWSRAAVRTPTALSELGIPLGGALLGLLAALPVIRRRSWWPFHAVVGLSLLWTLLLLVVLGVGIAAAAWFSYVCNPLVVVFAMGLSAVGGLALAWCRAGQFTHWERTS